MIQQFLEIFSSLFFFGLVIVTLGRIGTGVVDLNFYPQPTFLDMAARVFSFMVSVSTLICFIEAMYK